MRTKVTRIGVVLITVLIAVTLFASFFKYAQSQGDDFLEVTPREMYTEREWVDGDSALVLYSQWHAGNHEDSSKWYFRRYVLEDSYVQHQEAALANLLHSLEDASLRAERHRSAMLYFYYLHYAFIILQAVFGLVATALGLMISKNGWRNAGRWPMMLFFITAGCVYFLSVVPESLRVEQNIADNKEYYRTHIAIQSSIYHYLTTGMTSNGTLVSAIEFQRIVHEQLDEFHNVTIGFDQEHVKNMGLEMLEGMERAVPAAQPENSARGMTLPEDGPAEETAEGQSD